MAKASGRYNARSDWIRARSEQGHNATVMPTGRLRIMQIRARIELKCVFFSLIKKAI